MSLEDLRLQIDRIDTEIIRLLNERADYVHEIGLIKKRDGLEIYAPEREERLLRALVAKGEGGRLPENSIRAIYREIMSAALALEEDLKIAYLGPPGTWTHQAAAAKFGHSVKYLAQTSFADVFIRVERREADYGVVPIENSAEGAVRDVFQLFERHDLKICAEILLPVEICLMAGPGAGPIRRIGGHPANLAAAKRWIGREHPGCELVEFASTSLAAAEARQDPAFAAVGGLLAAEVAGLGVLARRIGDDESLARFSVIGRSSCPPTGRDRTLVTVSDAEFGKILFDTLRVMDSHGVETIRVDGHEAEGSEAAVVRFEVAGHAETPPLAEALSELASGGKRVAILGSYPDQRPGAGDCD